MKKYFKENKLKLGMFFLVFSMTIGFAALSTKLSFNGTATFAYSGDTNFQVYFSRAFLNDVGKANIISEDKNSISFTYSDISRKNADLKYTIKNTSSSYYADVYVSCKPRKADGTKFLYEENNYTSKKLRVQPGESLTDHLSVLLPNQSDSPTALIDQNTTLEAYVKSLSKGKDSSINFNNLNESGVYESNNTNSGNSVFYYRGTEESVNNYVLFAEKCWKVVRTTENGGVKLVYNGIPSGSTCLTQGAFLGVQDQTIEIDPTSKYNNNAYAGYMYGYLNATEYSLAHQNMNSSLFKNKIEEWYENNILGTNYEKYILDDIQYNDRSILTNYENINSSMEFNGLGFGTNSTLYQSSERSSTLAKNLSPTYKTTLQNDRFTVSDTTKGNGALKYPISTLTSDELVYAGVTNASKKSWLYLYDRLLFTISPIGYYNNTMNFVIQDTEGNLGSVPKSTNNKKLYILPTITVSSDLNILSGDGSDQNPFVLSSEDIYENSYTCSLNVDKIGYSKDVEVHTLFDLEVGEEYCFGEECFYAISNDKMGTVKLLAKYNLYVGRYYNSSGSYSNISTSDALYGKQHPTALGAHVSSTQYPRVGVVPYSSSTSNNTYENSLVKPYVDEYETYLKTLTGINLSASLITKDELVSLGCVVNSSSDSNCFNPNFDWVTSSTYWTMTPLNGTVYIVGQDGFFKAPTTTANLINNDSRGVRPVITISYAAKNPNVTFVSGNGENVGDELCIGEECFYVLNYDEENYTLFSKYNLYVGNEYASNANGAAIKTTDPLYGKQNPLALGDKTTPRYGTLSFADSQTAIKNYANYLNQTFGLTTTGRSISYDELIQTIGCVYGFVNSNKENRGCSPTDNPSVKYDWVTNTTYWGSANGSKAYLVGGDGFFLDVSSVTNATNRGARPVIVVKASEIKSPDYHVSSVPKDWNDNGIFSEYYEKAYQKLKTMSNEEKIGQLLVMSYTNQSSALNAIQNYNLGGVLFFESAFTGKTITQVQNMTSELQSKSKIPLLLPVDEEGGRVVRISSNTNLVAEELSKYPELFFTNVNSKNAWRLASDLYAASGNNFDLIIKEEQVRNNVLKKLGLNFNFAPVVDIANPPAYISDRSFGQSAELTGEYAKQVVTAGLGSGVSHSLKHFPGYGNNSDTHSSGSIDETSLEELKNTHLVPFIAGINAGAESVMVSHNTVAALDKEYPASLSEKVHNLLFNELGFTGLSITDDLSMSAVGNNYEKQYLKAFQAGNHILLCSSSYVTAYTEILTALNAGTITQKELDKRVFKVLAWKYYNGLLK